MYKKLLKDKSIYYIVGYSNSIGVGIRNNIIKYNVIVEFVSLQHSYIIKLNITYVFVFKKKDQFLTAFLHICKIDFLFIIYILVY